MTDTSLPFADMKFQIIKGRRMAYVGESDGPAMVFLHGSSTSSYLWHNVIWTGGVKRFIMDAIQSLAERRLTP